METTKVFDLKGAAEYLRSLGFSGATVWTMRALIHDGVVKAMRLGRKYYVSAEDLNTFVLRNLRRGKNGANAG